MQHPEFVQKLSGSGMQSFMPYECMEFGNLPIMIGEKIRKAREAKGYSQEQMADGIGISLSAYEKIESGESRVRPERVTQIAKVLGVDPIAWFLEEDEYRVVINNNHAETISENSIQQQIVEQNTELIHELLVAKDEQIKLLKETVARLEKLLDQS